MAAKSLGNTLVVNSEGYLETKDVGLRCTVKELKAFMQEHFPKMHIGIHVAAPIITDSVTRAGDWLCWCPDEDHFALMQSRDKFVWTGWRAL